MEINYSNPICKSNVWDIFPHDMWLMERLFPQIFQGQSDNFKHNKLDRVAEHAHLFTKK